MKRIDTLRRRLLRSAAGSLALAPAAKILAAVPGYSRLMEGPMVGAVTPDSLTIWARASGPLPLTVEYSTDPLFVATRTTSAVLASEANDFTARITLSGLQPATRYYYRVRVDEGVDRYKREPFATRTAPAGNACSSGWATTSTATRLFRQCSKRSTASSAKCRRCSRCCARCRSSPPGTTTISV